MLENDFDQLAPERDQQFCSLGFICQLLQIVPTQLQVLMEDSGLRFAMVLDGIGYLTVADAERLAEKCRDVRQEIHDTLEAAEWN
jgi:hypothetical protein